MSFFKWAQAEFKLQGNPVVPIRSPRLRDVERELFSAEDVAGIVAAQPELRDRFALKLLFLMGLRKGELAAIPYPDFDLGRRRLRVHGKGGKIRHTPIPTESCVGRSPSFRSGATRSNTCSTRRSAARRAT
jgi:integrase